MKNKMLSLLIGISAISCMSHANEGFQKGFYAGVSLGGSSFKGKRSDLHVSGNQSFQTNKTIRNTSERGEAFLGYFFPFYQNKIGVSFEGFYAFSSLEHTIRNTLELQPGTGTDVTERLQTKRSFGGNFKIGPIIHNRHFIGAILGVESTHYTRYHDDGFGQEFHKVSKQKAGFQYGLTYQYAWNDSSSIGIDLKQTRFSSIKLSKADSTNAVTTTRFKPNINSLVVRYTYRFY
ncbi:MAG: outer membrane beta-barrel protein [Candidatus Paracaedimonas acanthamoebae]|uniref:Outer membrane beta-barrel protein n=1 Tax=Candidatus Paracaedimonas acanthamoebae TaxID=244581 RepID=A0A8J7TTI1_9PROT|nr:outer membrane beta-barrel protein [Candidatus Paracaedimonas acanthamoebae]